MKHFLKPLSFNEAAFSLQRKFHLHPWPLPHRFPRENEPPYTLEEFLATNRTQALLIARRYATAIFAQSLAASQESAVVGEFASLARAIETDTALKSALANPLVGREAKGAVLSGLMKGAQALTLQSLETIVRGHRADVIPHIAQILKQELSKHKGERVAIVTSARPLPDAVQNQLRAALMKATGKAVEMELREDPSLLGGLTVQLGSQRLDATLAGALTNMKMAMTAPSHS